MMLQGIGNCISTLILSVSPSRTSEFFGRITKLEDRKDAAPFLIWLTGNGSLVIPAPTLFRLILRDVHPCWILSKISEYWPKMCVKPCSSSMRKALFTGMSDTLMSCKYHRSYSCWFTCSSYSFPSARRVWAFFRVEQWDVGGGFLHSHVKHVWAWQTSGKRTCQGLLFNTTCMIDFPILSSLKEEVADQALKSSLKIG